MSTSPFHHFRGLGKLQRPAFTLLELLVAMSVLSLVMVLLFSMVNSVSGLWRRTTGKIATFQEARAGFETMTRKLSQATLNTYWDYDPPVSAGVPTRYVRQSDLHFICGQADTLLGGSIDDELVTHSVFFQAPIGYSAKTAQGTSNVQLENLLNSSGFFVQHGSDADDRPNFLKPFVPARTAYRLMELWQPTEEFSVYSHPAGALEWFTQPLASTPSAARPLAENIIAMVLWPRRAVEDVGDPLTTDYSYDSRRYVTAPGNALAELTRNQLPPIVAVTMVAVDQASARRLEEPLSGKEEVLGTGALFMSLGSGDNIEDQEEAYAIDLSRLEAFLREHRLNYRFFTTNVSIRQAKWNAQ